MLYKSKQQISHRMILLSIPYTTNQSAYHIKGNIRGLDIPMHDILTMQIIQCRGNIEGNLQAFWMYVYFFIFQNVASKVQFSQMCSTPLYESRVQRFEESIHDDHGRVWLSYYAIDLNNVRMMNARKNPPLRFKIHNCLKPSFLVLVVGDAWMKLFHSISRFMLWLLQNMRSLRKILNFVNDAKGSFSKLLADANVIRT